MWGNQGGWRANNGWGRPAASGGVTTTLNPADIGANVQLSNGNLTVTNSGSPASANSNVRSVASYSTGKYYCEISITSNATAYAHGIGIANSSASLTVGPGSPDANSACLFNGDNSVYVANNAGTNIGGSYTTTDIVQMAVDMGNSNIWYRVNSGNWNGNVSNDPATNVGGVSLSTVSKPWFVITAAVKTSATNGVHTFNFGATAYSFTPPSGFGNW